MTSRAVGSAAVIRGSEGSPHRPTPRPTGPHYPPGRTVRLHARIPGYVKTLNVDIGSRVKKGDEIAELEAPEVKAEYARAQAEVQGAKAGILKAAAAAAV